MPSKYTATLGLTQEQMDKLAELEPEINDAIKFTSTSSIISHLINKLANGDYVEKSLVTSDELKELAIEEKKQRVLDYKIKNRRNLIHDLKVAPTEAIEITNGALKLEMSNSALARFDPTQTFDLTLSNKDSPYNPIRNFRQGGKTICNLKCITCGAQPEHFQFTKGSFNSFQSALLAYRYHLDDFHEKRKMTDSENDAFQKITDECDE